MVVSFLFLRGAKCEPQFDRLERVRREFGEVNFVGVFFERDRDRIGDVVKHDWSFPVVVDPRRRVSNLYAVGGCPTTVFAARGEVAACARPAPATSASAAGRAASALLR